MDSEQASAPRNQPHKQDVSCSRNLNFSGRSVSEILPLVIYTFSFAARSHNAQISHPPPTTCARCLGSRETQKLMTLHCAGNIFIFILIPSSLFLNHPSNCLIFVPSENQNQNQNQKIAESHASIETNQVFPTISSPAPTRPHVSPPSYVAHKKIFRTALNTPPPSQQPSNVHQYPR